MRLRTAITLAALLAPLALVACNKGNDKAAPAAMPVDSKPKPAAAPGELPDDAAKTLYALGLDVGLKLKVFSPTPEEVGYIIQGFKDSMAGAQPKLELQEWGPKIGGLAQARQKIAADKAKEASAPALEALAKSKGAKKTSTGLVFVEKKAGTGASPKQGDRVKVNYKGTLADGSTFDESKQPAEFVVGSVVPCWNEALGMMKPGGSADIGCPAELGYGDRGSPPKIAGGAALFFHIEVLEVTAGTGADPAMGAPGGMDPRSMQQMDPRMLQQLRQQMQQGGKGGMGAPNPH